VLLLRFKLNYLIQDSNSKWHELTATAPSETRT